MIRVLAFALLYSVSGKTYERCELAKELRYAYEVPESEVGTWVCIAEHESQYNTSAIGMLNGDGSSDHGIFQISDEYWCSPPGKGWACGLTCAELEDDDIEDDFNCAKRIFREHKILSGDGFSAWAVYEPYCRGQRAQKYAEGCFNETDEVPHPKKKIPTKKVYPWLVSKPSSTTPPTEKTSTESQTSNEGLSRCFIGRNDDNESTRTKTVSSETTTAAPRDHKSSKNILPTSRLFTSSVPLFNSITSVPQFVSNRQTLSRSGNIIQPTSESFPSSAPFSSIGFTSTSTKSPSLSRVSQFTNSGTTSSKFDSSSTHFNGLTPIAELISNRQTSSSPFGNRLPLSPVLQRTRPATVTATTIFPGISKVPAVASVRTVIGQNNRFTSSPQRIPFTAAKESSFTDQTVQPQRIQREPSFIVNGRAWV